ncbi:MAG TPA: toll/interleukin-1 receptor domain-containing protein [Hyphomonadaceae bacterium]|jgi:hypothetical protein|nr:toll/interleukin-1 receptor domain-containing protein [Hyphomonadaceae bacterium]
MADVFLSYSSKDRAAAERVQQVLERAGIDVFWDQETPAGADWDTWIRDKLANAKAAVVLWSKESVKSPNVRHEAVVARDAGKLVPVMIDTLAPSDFPMGLYLVQGVQLQDWRNSNSGGMARLISEVEARLGRGSGAGHAPPKNPGKIRSVKKPSPVPLVLAGLAAAAVLGGAGWFVFKPDRPEGLSVVPETTMAEAKPDAPVDGAKSLPTGDGFSKRMLGHWRTADNQACKDGTNVTLENDALVFTAPGSRYVHAIMADAPLRTQTSVLEPAEHRSEEYVLTPEFRGTSDVRSFTLIVESATTKTRDTWEPCEL